MGNGFPGKIGSRVLEFRLSPIAADPPRGRNGLPCNILARIGIFEDDDEFGDEVAWDEGFILQLPTDQSVVAVNIFARETGMEDPEERFLTQVCLPYLGPGCLRDLGVHDSQGVPVVLKVALTTGNRHSTAESLQDLTEALQEARRNLRSDRPCLSLSVRELVDRPSDAGVKAFNNTNWSLPAARRELIALELMHASLLHQKRKLLPGEGQAGSHDDEPLDSTPTCAQQLDMILGENEQLKLEMTRSRNHLERSRALLCGSEADLSRMAQGMDWKKTLSVMQQELSHCKDRQEKIRVNYEERVASLQRELQQAWQGAAPSSRRNSSMEVTFNPRTQAQLEMVEQEVVTMQALIEDATMRRDDLLYQLSEAKKAVAAQGVPGSTGSMKLVEGARALSNEDLRRARSQGELRQLGLERDSLRERLEEATSEVQHLRTQGEAIKVMQGVAADSLHPLVAELTSLREANVLRATELDRRRLREQERRKAIDALEREQEVLMDQISSKTVPLVDHTEEYLTIMEAKAEELSLAMERSQRACQEYEVETMRLRQAAADAQLAVEVLRKNYQALQLSSGKSPSINPKSSASLASRSSLPSTGQSLN